MEEPASFHQAIGTGTIDYHGEVVICLEHKGKKTKIRIQNALYSPKSDCNLISAEQIYESTGIYLDRPSCGLMREGKQVGSVTPTNRVLILHNSLMLKPEKSIDAIAALAVRQERPTSTLWHERLGHVGESILKQTKKALPGLELLDTSELTHCHACKLSKSQRIVSRIPRTRPLKALDEVHVDLSGKISPPDLYGHQYVMIITCAKTRRHWPIFLINKGDAAAKLAQWLKYIWNRYKKQPTLWFSDGGGEFQNKALQEWAAQEGVRWHFSTPGTAEQNGTAEAANKVIFSKARAIIIASGIPIELWCFAIRLSSWITDRLVNLAIGEIPLQVFYRDLDLGDPLIDLTKVRKFGCKAYKHDDKLPSSQKFAPRAQIYWHIGFQEDSSTNYLLWRGHFDKAGQKWIHEVKFSPHVQFDEHTTFGSMLSLPSIEIPSVQEELLQ